jgi:hypothetical protein
LSFSGLLLEGSCFWLDRCTGSYQKLIEVVELLPSILMFLKKKANVLKFVKIIDYLNCAKKYKI